MNLENGTILELGDLIFRQHALIGRGTCVIRTSVKAPQSNNDPWPGKLHIVKFSFTPKDKDEISYESRVLQVLLMTELFPIAELTTTNTLVPAIRDVFRCEFSDADRSRSYLTPAFPRFF